MKTRTKFFLTFLGGFIAGIISTFFLALAVEKTPLPSADESIVMLDEPQQEVKSKSFRVIQVLSNGDALAVVDDFSDELGLTVLFPAKKGTVYYDNQEINTPSKKKAMIVGTFRYITQKDTEKTVPIIEFMNR